MNLNDKYRPASRQAPGMRCIGCHAASAPGTLASRIISPNGAPPAVDCTPRTQRAAADPQRRRALEVCAAAGVPFTAIERLFVRLGVFEVLVTLEGIDDAIGLPAGSSAAAAAALRGGR